MRYFLKATELIIEMKERFLIYHSSFFGQTKHIWSHIYV